MPTIVGILTYMSEENFMLIWVEHEKSFITSGPGEHKFKSQSNNIISVSGIIRVKMIYLFVVNHTRKTSQINKTPFTE